MDSMRAIAALSVLTFHTLYQAGLPQPFEGYARAGNQGVAVFFLISGLLLYHPFATAHIRQSSPPWVAGYAWRRALRIIPVYWIALLALAVFSSKAEPLPGGALRYFLFGQIYDHRTIVHGISQAWTLDVEVTFYLLIPVFALLVRSTRRKTEVGRLRAELAALAGLAALSWIFRLWVHSHFDLHDPHSFPYRYALPYHLDLFAIGMALAVGTVWWREHPRFDIGRVVDRAPWVCWLVALGALTAISLEFGGADRVESWNGDIGLHLLVVVMAVAALLPAAVGEPGKGSLRRRVLADPRLLWLGLISYSIYLWHGGIATRVAPHIIGNGPSPLDAIGAELAVVALAVVVSAVSYRLIEQPALGLGRLVPRYRRPADRAAAALDEHAAP